MMRAVLGSAGLYVITKRMVSVSVLGLFLSASVRGTSEALCIWVLRKVLVVAATNKVIYKFISTRYVIVVVGANMRRRRSARL